MKKSQVVIIFLSLVFFIISLNGCYDVDKSNNTSNINNDEKNSDYSSDENTSDEVVLASSDGSILATYTTKFSADVPTRNKNIKLAAENINDTVLKPGDVFSFNKEVGPTGKNNGFKKARIFVNGKESYGFGGGVCQVSSTVYNAALAGGMEIVERHPHTKKVTYVPNGKDAATSYGDKLDFKFKNNKDFAIKIQTKCDETKVTVNIIKA